MAPPKVYNSLSPDVEIPNCSIFTYLFNSSDGDQTIGGHSGSLPGIIESESCITLTRSQLKQKSFSFAYGLKNHPKLKLKRGETVLIFAPNSFAWPVVFFGCFAAGLTITLANSAYTPSELASQFQETQPSLIIAGEENILTVLVMLKSLGCSSSVKVMVAGQGSKWAGGLDGSKMVPQEMLSFEDILDLGSLDEEESFDGRLSEEVALICFSSGTSGQPKGVMTTHRNLVANLRQTFVDFPRTRPGDKIYGILPFTHAYGSNVFLQYLFSTGAALVIGPRFDPVSFCSNIEKHRITAAFVVPPILVVLAHHPVVSEYDLSSLEWMLCGAAPTSAELVALVTNRIFNQSKNRRRLLISQAYGSTELSPMVTVLPLKDCERKVGSVGVLLPNCQVRIVLDADGKEDAKIGEPGEIWVRGPNVMKGYLNRLDATAESITSDGFYKTGDVGIRDNEGFYYIVDRLKELIKYNGFQVAPAELEAVLLTHPSIIDAAVIGIQDHAHATEIPRAYVVHGRPSSEVDASAFEKEVQEWMESKVAKHKYLRGGVEIVDVIPKSPSGKILRRELREKVRLQNEMTLKTKL
ncbi:AMP binding protein [Flagelloscypha sp. PMI_526]|nr:AMP binding protein [Flagelloscypha sp. PMI_526]